MNATHQDSTTSDGNRKTDAANTDQPNGNILKEAVEKGSIKPGENVSLEKIVRDMANVLYNLKTSIKLVKSKHIEKSAYNIQNEIEQIYQKQEECNRKKENEAKQTAQETSASKIKQQQLQNPNNTNNNYTTLNSNGKNSFKHGAKMQVNNKNVVNKPSMPPRPKSAANDTNHRIVVSNLRFPNESKENNNGKTKTERQSVNDTKISSNYSNKPTLRKPAPNAHQKKTVSIPPPREVYDPLGILRNEVEKAIREQKTFTIKGQFPAVRRALLKRGWIEKYHANYRDRLNNDIRKYQQLSLQELTDLLRNKDLANTIKKMVTSKLLKDHQVDLYWDHTFDAFKECPDSRKLTLINRFRREPFSYTSKQGLCQAARDAHWLQIPGVARINHPRCYVLTKGGETKTFLKDFGLTAAISLLKWVVKSNITGECKIIGETGKIPMKAFDFAVSECYKYVKKEKHDDIDVEIRDALEMEWNEFLDQYYKVVHIGNHFKLNKNCDASQETKSMVRKANYMLNQLEEYMHNLEMDGYMNIWILKPTNSSRGEGIHICRTLQYILDTVRKNPNRRYVIQKYIERPLLIHETKFDIRQWFLVSSAYPLIIWMYKLCYLRFSSQTYNLRKLHESIHLTNNSVQAKYLQHGTRDPLLPSYGMWDSRQFKSYLSDIGYPSIFETVIYPGMKECITGAMIAHRDKVDTRKNCFELYGADFMLSEKFDPWMLEINSNPALHASTPVTAKLCPEVLEDVIKVVIDHARNQRASTGNFELIYKEKLEAHTHITKASENLEVNGTPLPENYFCDVATLKTPLKDPTRQLKKFGAPDPEKFLIQTSETMKEALKALLEIVRREKLKRRSRKEAKSGTDESSNKSHSEVISLFQGAKVLHINSDHSAPFIRFDSQEDISENGSEKVPDTHAEISPLHNNKQILSGLVQVVNTLKNARKI